MYLLDTPVACWAALEAERLTARARSAIEQALATQMLAIADISLWEMAVLIQQRHLVVTLPLQEWIHQLVTSLHLHVIPMTPQIAAESVQLPEGFHGEPADHLILATARCLNATLITQDETMLTWAQAGFVRTLRA